MLIKKPMFKNKLEKLLSELKKFKAQTVLVLDYKKRSDCKNLYLCTKLIGSDSNNDETFKFMHQSIMTRIKNYACKDWIVLDVIIKHIIKMFE